ncbi:UNKNOWN [Stylonychia lemnae]|uniref:Uncharacterized protein n=1 Tax=Stylonychia lemnae TaxID=5949 RepID=A0A078B6H5_STYLE|nr:UNKNOWN [Stylonychia lemnae]|eukprot:CDW89826.1 UNKNOWN [Stylonychia lemnae]
MYAISNFHKIFTNIKSLTYKINTITVKQEFKHGTQIKQEHFDIIGTNNNFKTFNGFFDLTIIHRQVKQDISKIGQIYTDGNKILDKLNGSKMLKELSIVQNENIEQQYKLIQQFENLEILLIKLESCIYDNTLSTLFNIALDKKLKLRILCLEWTNYWHAFAPDQLIRILKENYLPSLEILRLVHNGLEITVVEKIAKVCKQRKLLLEIPNIFSSQGYNRILKSNENLFIKSISDQHF